MPDARLNPLAIAVFAMTLSALVGPALQISPAIPAVITLGGLTLITADQWQWNGRGTDLVASWFQSKEERQRLLCHEAGHFLVAYCLEIPVKDYSLSAWEVLKQGETGMAGVQFDLSQVEADCSRWQTRPQSLERWATVWMAGIAAEKLMYGNSTGGEGDQQQLRAAFRAAGLPGAQLPLKESWAFLQAQTLLQNHQQAHEQLQQALAERRSVAECYQCLAQAIPVEQKS